MQTRRLLLKTLTALPLAAALPAAAHHGWRWTDAGEFELSGAIAAVRLGNPHGVLSVEANGEVWTAEIGQPWRNEQAGLTEDLMVIGRDIILRGHRAADPADLRMKAERVIIAGVMHDLYPDRS